MMTVHEKQVRTFANRQGIGDCNQEPSRQTEFKKMMTFRQVGEYVTAEPFRPFRIKMASGTIYEIRHPEMILVFIELLAPLEAAVA